ncbi:ABC transporter permease [Streptomyces sp. YC504]|uniref:ABC transporter permease n=1 Tax=Streptomyces mesophilus TaxID=1775132 RepID=A0A6G4XW69_9ACTN|nr:FtsX-like permease family protein [Streptomyces mesophilus]NGO80851.1 ABC transporter permease [Streptomyces mesophilus]
MFRTALRNVFAHKARLLMTVLAVMLGVSFVSGTLVFTDSVSQAIKNNASTNYKDVDVVITPKEGRNQEEGKPGQAPKLTQDLLDKVEATTGVKSATGSVSGYTAVADKKGKLVGDGWASTGTNYLPGADGKDDRYPMESGTGPSSANEIALDSKTAERAGYKVGDTVRLSVNGPVITPKITGIFDADDNGSVSAGGTLVTFDNATAQKQFAKPGEYDQIMVTAAPGTGQAELRDALAAAVPKTADLDTADKLVADQEKTIDAETSGIKTFMLVFAGIALFVGIFIIANTFTMLVAQRSKEIALMRAVGASRKQITRSVLAEAFFVGLVAAVVGLAAGIGIGVGMRSILGTNVGLPDGPTVIAPATVISAFAVGIVVTMLSAWLPGRRAAKIPPVAAMNALHAAPTTKGLVVRNTIGAVFSGLGIAAVLYGRTMAASDAKLPMGLGAALLVIGIFVLTPLLSRPVIGVAAPLLKAFGISGKLSRQNAVRNPRRTAATASALMIGLTLLTGITVIAGTLQKSIDKMATEALRSDYVVSMTNQSPLSPEVEKTLAKTDGVTATTPLRMSPTEVYTTDGGSRADQLIGVNGKTIEDLVKLDFAAGGWNLTGDNAVVDSDTAKAYGWKNGQSVDVTYEDGKRGKLNLVGVYEGNEMIKGLMVDTSVLTPHMKTEADFQVMLKTSDGVSEATKDKLVKALGENPAISVDDKADISKEIGGMFNMILNMLYGLLAMAVLVAVIGVINTLAMSVFERRQEIGMLRAIGLDRKGIKRMVRLEAIAISVFGGVLGIGLGLFFGWATGELLKSALTTYTLVIPWGRMGIFLALAGVVGVLAALWPARRAANLNMLEAIKAE